MDETMLSIEPWELAIERGCISVDDGIRFKTITDVCRCFGRNPKRMQRCFISLERDNYFLWCPKLAVKRRDGSTRSAAFGVVNTMSEDGTQIFSRYEYDAAMGGDEDHVTFMGVKEDGRLYYRFIGVFKNEGPLSDDRHVVAYRRVADTLDITPWNYVPMVQYHADMPGPVASPLPFVRTQQIAV